MGVKFFILIPIIVIFCYDSAVVDAEVAIENNDAIDIQILEAVVNMIRHLGVTDFSYSSLSELDFGKLNIAKRVEGEDKLVVRKVLEGIEQEADSLAVRLSKWTWTILGNTIDNPKDVHYGEAKKRPLEEDEKEEFKHGVGKIDERQKNVTQFIGDFQRILTYCNKATSALNEHLKVATTRKNGNVENWLVVSSYPFGGDDLEQLLLRLNRINPADNNQLKTVLAEPKASMHPYNYALIAGVCRKAAQLDATYRDNDGKMVECKVKDMPEGMRHIILYTQLVTIALEIVDEYWGKQYNEVVEKHQEILEKLKKALEVGHEDGQFGKHTCAGWRQLGENEGEAEYHTLSDLSVGKVEITDINEDVNEEITINLANNQTPNQQEEMPGKIENLNEKAVMEVPVSHAAHSSPNAQATLSSEHSAEHRSPAIGTTTHSSSPLTGKKKKGGSFLKRTLGKVQSAIGRVFRG